MRFKGQIGIWLCLLAFCLMQPAGAFAAGGWYTAGQAAGVYEIGTAAELRELAALVNDAAAPHSFAGETVVLTADIDLGGSDFTPIGHDTQLSDVAWPFCGTFDGGGHTISGLKTVRPEWPAEDMPRYNQALFGYVENAVIKNLTVRGSVASEYDNAAGLVASFKGDRGLISNCVSEVEVKGKSFVGGIVGSSYCKELRLENCQNLGAVTAARYAGGLLGTGNMENVTVCGSENRGAVTGTEYCAGGLIGSADEVELTDCANYGAVFGKSVAGGLVGESASSFNYTVTVRRCLNAADVSGEQMVGGIDHYIISRPNDRAIVWRNGSIEGSITGGITVAEAKQIVDSIYAPEGTDTPAATASVAATLAAYEDIDRLRTVHMPYGYTYGYTSMEATEAQMEVASTLNATLAVTSTYSRKTDDGYELLQLGCRQLTDHNPLPDDPDSAAGDIYESHGTEHYIMAYAGQVNASWRVGDAEYWFSGSMTLAEAEQMIDSLYE